MLILPNKIDATIVDEATGVSLGADILVALRLLVARQVYYADVMGLTDRDGQVVLTREQLEHKFRENQKAFPMDYRIPLVDCDPAFRIVVPGGADFVEMQRQVADTRWVAPDVRATYERAQNVQFNTTAQQVDVTGVATDVLRIAVPVTRRL